jgi:predicted transcriptional regulator
VKSQTEQIYDKLVEIRPFGMTANYLFEFFEGAIPKVSVNRALNELRARGFVIKKEKRVPGTEGRSVHQWRATYKEKI